jgi:hypothetical protein
MISQIDIRHSVCDTIADVQELASAFSGNLTFCIATGTLYSYKIYDIGDSIPTADNKLVIQPNLLGTTARWVAIDIFSAKSITGTFATGDWVYSSDGGGKYTYTITLINNIDKYVIKVLDYSGKEVLMDSITSTVSESDEFTCAINLNVSSIPDARFEGSYCIIFDRMK